jgi:hypothetical protein
MIDSLGGNDRFNKRGVADQVDVLPIPSWKLTGAFILKVLKISSPKAPKPKEVGRGTAKGKMHV